VHQTLEKVSDDIGRRYTFNTAIAAAMELLNRISKYAGTDDQDRAVIQEALDMIVRVLSPIVPHICHRLWHVLGHEASVVDEAWPVVDADALRSDHVQIIVQVNGKLRARLQLPAAAPKDQIEAAALADENVRRFVADKPIRKIIIVPGKLINVVV
jgi:leucyl-tRNA synthetase